MRIVAKHLASWMVVAALVCAPLICGQEVGAPSKSIALTPDVARLFTYTFIVSPMLGCRKIA